MVYPSHYNGVAPLVVVMMMMMMMMKAVVLKNGRPQRAGSPAVLMLSLGEVPEPHTSGVWEKVEWSPTPYHQQQQQR